MRNMVKSLSAILLIIFALSCATSEKNVYISPLPKKVIHHIDEEFQPYIEEFIYRSKGLVERRDFKYVTIRLVEDIKGDTVGTCLPWLFNRVIEIEKKSWDRYGQIDREQLMFHEFGHCILWREHTEPPEKTGGFVNWLENLMFKIGLWKKKGYMDDGCPVSYMHPRMIGSDCVEKHYEYYMEELFSHRDVKVIEEKEELEWMFYYEYQPTDRTCDQQDIRCLSL